MFDSSYSCEKSIKKWASAFKLIGRILMWASVLAAFIVFCINPSYTWWISLIILGGGILVYVSLLFYATLLWGFGDIVGTNAKKGVAAQSVQNKKIDLPDL